MLHRTSIAERLTGRSALEVAEAEIVKLRRRLARVPLAEKDDQGDDPGVADRVTAPNQNEPREKKQPGDENEKTDQELDDEASRIAREIERRRKLRQKKVADDLEDTSASPPEDTRDESASLPGDARYAQDTRYRLQCDAAAAYITRVHSQIGGRAPTKVTVSVDDALALAPTLTYPDRVRLLSAAISAADRRRRGEV